MINIAILGYGTVGSGVAELIDKNKNIFTKKAGDEIYVKYIIDIRDFPGDKYEDRFIKDFDVILQDKSISTVVETIGGTKAVSYTHLSRLSESDTSLLFSVPFAQLNQRLGYPIQKRPLA